MDLLQPMLVGFSSTATASLGTAAIPAIGPGFNHPAENLLMRGCLIFNLKGPPQPKNKITRSAWYSLTPACVPPSLLSK